MIIELAGLTTYIVGPVDPTGRARPAGGAVPGARDPGSQDPITTCVLLHGFGAPGDDLVSLADGLHAPVRFVFPAAPLALGGPYGDARAWWMIELGQLEDERRRGVPRDRRMEIPDGLAVARAQMLQLIDQLQARFAIAPERLVLGGFSQGAMLALDVALHRDPPPAGLILMSGTLLAEPVWQPRMATLAGVPVVLSHGQHDGLLPFSAAELLRDRLVAAGAIVDWQPFRGGHEIPTAVLDAAGQLLRAVGSPGRPA